MRKLKLSLKKEVISDLEAKEVKGGIIASINGPECESNELTCTPKTQQESECFECFPTFGEATCILVCD